MRKVLTATIAAATIAGTLAVSLTDADAQWRRRGWGWGPGIAAGIIGGVALGAILATRPRGYVVYEDYGQPVHHVVHRGERGLLLQVRGAERAQPGLPPEVVNGDIERVGARVGGDRVRIPALEFVLARFAAGEIEHLNPPAERGAGDGGPVPDERHPVAQDAEFGERAGRPSGCVQEGECVRVEREVSPIRRERRSGKAAKGIVLLLLIVPLRPSRTRAGLVQRNAVLRDGCRPPVRVGADPPAKDCRHVKAAKPSKWAIK